MKLTRHVAVVAGLTTLATVGVVQAQSAFRIRGTARQAGAGVAATVGAEAVHGFRGGQFVGQKSFSVHSNRDGRWTILGLTAGAWVFTAHSRSHFPQVVALPVQFAEQNRASAIGGRRRGRWRSIWCRANGDAPGLARAHLGLASAAFMDGLWDAANRAFWVAREKGLSPSMARAVGAAIAEFQKLGGPTDRSRCPGGLPGC